MILQTENKINQKQKLMTSCVTYKNAKTLTNLIEAVTMQRADTFMSITIVRHFCNAI